ncbi:MFS transporter [Corynebacterium sp. p3-SID1056]|uniref:MFS transporter n=1 Tax=Corynebacterium sp. p3-SID1056 TaxID=2916092 RepID=UPI0021A8FE73|nr:MFS transporter [Corynebacterium sp. p3-SID1056]MCT2338265.1 MFS transporter [Corynebacterium sp. p3-SID1056]
MTNITHAPPADHAKHERTPKERRLALASSFLGSTVEYYDFLLYAAAAGLVFPQLFFANIDPRLGTMLSFVILLTGYLSRPIGSMAFGHFGDKYGRKNVLVITLLTMGLVSISIGLMPSSQVIGAAAPILLVILRIVQGIAIGGEWAGATLMAMENSTAKNKGFGASIAIAGGPAGAILSTLVLAVFAQMSGDNFANPEQYFVTDWGWRVPFLFSAAIVIVGLFMRANVKESPEFEAARRAGKVHTGVPLVRMLKEAPRELVLGALAGMAGLFVQGLQGSFMVPYIVNATADTASPVSRSTALMMVTVGSAFAIFVMPALAALSDRLGRRRVMLAGGLVSIVGIWIVFNMIDSGDPTKIWLGMVLLVCVVQPAQYGPIGAFISEKFVPELRYTGSGITYQAASILGAGTAPLVATRFVTPETGLTPLAIIISGLFVISSLAIFFSKETAHHMSHAERFTETNLFKG